MTTIELMNLIESQRDLQSKAIKEGETKLAESCNNVIQLANELIEQRDIILGLKPRRTREDWNEKYGEAKKV